MRKVITEIEYTTDNITYGKEFLRLILAQKEKEDAHENDSRGKKVESEFWKGVTVGMSIMALWVAWLQ